MAMTVRVYVSFLAAAVWIFSPQPGSAVSIGIPANFSNSEIQSQSHVGVRIVQGENTAIEMRPYQVSIQFYWRHMCGAIIVSERWVVTAAHCVRMMEKGPSWAKSIKCGTPWNVPYSWFGTRHRIVEAEIHPKYSKTVDYDVGLVRIEGKFEFGAKSQPALIPLSGESYLTYERPAIVSGWGRTVEGGWFFAMYLQSVEVPLMHRKRCQDIYSSTRYIVTDRMLCAAGVGRGSPCQGDSGSPMTQDGKVIGLVSWGMRCGDDKYPSVLTNLLDPEIRAYINDKTGA